MRFSSIFSLAALSLLASASPIDRREVFVTVSFDESKVVGTTIPSYLTSVAKAGAKQVETTVSDSTALYAAAYVNTDKSIVFDLESLQDRDKQYGTLVTVPHVGGYAERTHSTAYDVNKDKTGLVFVSTPGALVYNTNAYIGVGFG